MTPNRDIIRRKALSAAASVVLAFGAVACDPSVLGGDSATDTSVADTDDTDTSGADTGETCVGLENEALSDCCAELAATCNAEYGEGTEEASTCTYGPDYDGSTGCIPWGPPAPPRFREAVA
jgi:hypothetical protein